MSFHILILSGRRVKTLMEKVSLSFGQSSEKRGLHPVYCWATVFSSLGFWQEKCQASFWHEFASLNDGWQHRKAKRKPAHRSARGNYSKKQMSRRSREILIPPPPSLKTATCFKEPNFIKLCHSPFVSQCGGLVEVVVVGFEGSGLRHRRAINSGPPSVLFSCIRKQQAGCHGTLPRRHNTANTGNEAAHTQVYTPTQTHAYRKYCKKQYMHTRTYTSGGKVLLLQWK